MVFPSWVLTKKHFFFDLHLKFYFYFAFFFFKQRVVIGYGTFMPENIYEIYIARTSRLVYIVGHCLDDFVFKRLRFMGFNPPHFFKVEVYGYLYAFSSNDKIMLPPFVNKGHKLAFINFNLSV